MIKNLKSFFAVVLLTVLAGCATVNLLPEVYSLDTQSAQKGRAIILNAVQKHDLHNLWSKFNYMKVIATDLWMSSSQRRLTPIPQAEQQIQFAFNLLNTNAYMKILTGDHAGNIIGIENDKTYMIIKGKRTQKTSQRVNWYLPAVRDYFFWPQTLYQKKYIYYLEPEDMGYSRYDKVFVSDGDLDSLGQHNQYIVWVNQKTSQIEYIEFTSRERSKSYRGIVRYRSYREDQGVDLPREIILLDKLGSEKYSHQFKIQIITLE